MSSFCMKPTAKPVRMNPRPVPVDGDKVEYHFLPVNQKRMPTIWTAVKYHLQLTSTLIGGRVPGVPKVDKSGPKFGDGGYWKVEYLS